MAFRDIDRRLIAECTKDNVALGTIKALIESGADVNAFDEEYEQGLYNEVLDYYINAEEPNLSTLYKITKLFLENNMVLNQKLGDHDYFLPGDLRFLPPEKTSVDTFKLLLEKGNASSGDFDAMISDAILDLHLDMFCFYEEAQYTREDSVNYYLELIYWACAYNAKAHPEKCSEDILRFNWFERDKNRIGIAYCNRSTSVYVEDLETHTRAEINGWSTKY